MGKKASNLTRDHVHKRLHFEFLHTHREWRRIAEDAGFVIEFYEDLDKHMAQTYRDMEIKARNVGFKSADGALLADNYAMTVKATEEGENGMNLALLRDGLPYEHRTDVDTSNVYVQNGVAFARKRILEGALVERGLVKRLPWGADFAFAFPWLQTELAIGSGAVM